jgi:DmsE family decaheme c-type cytochrome
MKASLLLLLLLAACSSTGVHVDEDAAPPPGGATYAGTDTCVVCHEEQATSYAKTIHAHVLGDERPENERGCEGCHGPGAAHAEAGGGKGVGGLQAFGRDDPASGKSAACLRCHAANVGRHDFLRGEHALSGVACTDCHGGHWGAGDAMLLRGGVPELCYGCHADVRAAFNLPERHGPGAAPPACGDCHEPHGTPNLASLREANDRRCLECHNDIAGPFVFEHAAVVSEGCTGCHEPHGSVNRHLLTRQPVAMLCYQCHTVTPRTHLQPTYRDCTRCHASIHGSNTDPRFIAP